VLYVVIFEKTIEQLGLYLFLAAYVKKKLELGFVRGPQPRVLGTGTLTPTPQCCLRLTIENLSLDLRITITICENALIHGPRFALGSSPLEINYRRAEPGLVNYPRLICTIIGRTNKGLSIDFVLYVT